MFLPFDVLNLILQYDGRIKYIHGRGIYVNVFSKLDSRYNIVQLLSNNKLDIIDTLSHGLNGLPFYVDVRYKDSEIGLVFSKKLLQ